MDTQWQRVTASALVSLASLALNHLRDFSLPLSNLNNHSNK